MNIIFEFSIESKKLIEKDGKRKRYKNYLHYHQKEILEKILTEMIDANNYECKQNYFYKEKVYENQRREGELYSVGYIKNISNEEMENIKNNICDKLKISNKDEKTFKYEENNMEWYENKLKEGIYKYKKIVKS